MLEMCSAWARTCCSCAPRRRRTRRPIAMCSRATCASSRCSRCRSASRSPTKACRGAAPSTNFPMPGTSCAAPTRPISASASTPSTPSPPVLARGPGNAVAGQDLPRAARRFHVAGDPHRRGAHPDRAPFPRLSGRGRAQRSAGRARDGLDALGYRGDYSFEVFNDDYSQLPLPTVAARARRSAIWLSEDILRRSVPLPNEIRLRAR